MLNLEWVVWECNNNQVHLEECHLNQLEILALLVKNMLPN